MIVPACPAALRRSAPMWVTERTSNTFWRLSVCPLLLLLLLLISHSTRRRAPVLYYPTVPFLTGLLGFANLNTGVTDFNQHQPSRRPPRPLMDLFLCMDFRLAHRIRSRTSLPRAILSGSHVLTHEDFPILVIGH